MYDDLGLGLHENEADAGVPADFIDALNDCSQDGNCWAVRTAPVCSKCVVYVHVRAKERGLVCVLGFGICERPQHVSRVHVRPCSNIMVMT